MKESIPRQGDKSGVPEEEKGVWSSQGGEKNIFFSLSPELMIVQHSN